MFTGGKLLHLESAIASKKYIEAVRKVDKSEINELIGSVQN